MSGDDLHLLLRALRDVRGVRRLLCRLGLASPAAAKRSLRLAGAAYPRARLVATGRGIDGWLVEVGAAGGVADVARMAKKLRASEPFGEQLVVAPLESYAQVVIGVLGAGEDFRHLLFEPAHVLATDIEVVAEMIAADGEAGIALAARYARALDRTRIGRRFFDAFRLHRSRLAQAWTGVPAGASAERAQLALLLLCRVMFLYFLQRRGHLGGRGDYLIELVAAHTRQPGRRTFYRRTLVPLFFGALNRRPERRAAAARALGELPYLNGGLFERHALERAHRALDLPDEVLLPVFDELFERFRFTTAESAESAADALAPAGVDPEMLGRVFEGMMAAQERGDSGTFFTPPGTVDRVVRQVLTVRLAALTALPEALVARAVDGDASGLDAEAAARLRGAAAALRVLDPACGSGAFLLGTLSRLARLRGALGGVEPGDVRRAIVAQTLHGVDVQADAALLCALRLWLALASDADEHGEAVPPLPNLDRRIRQGDSLVDPLDLGLGAGDALFDGAARDRTVRAAVRALAPHAERYTEAPPEERGRLAALLARGEQRLAAAWFAALHGRCARALAELQSRAGERDLFGELSAAALAAAHERDDAATRLAGIERWRTRLRDDGVLPFFSYPIHFADATAGFDMVVTNPPWVRAHRWPAGMATALRSRYEVCSAGQAGRGAGQVDLSLLFLERSLRLCADGGAVGAVLPAKLLRSAYAGTARRMLLRETRLVSVDDDSLDQRAIFSADAYAATVVAQRGHAAPARTVRVRMGRRRVEPLEFDIAAGDLPLDRRDAASPWLIAPPAVRRALRRMQAAGLPLGRLPGITLRRGIVTGANDVLVVAEVVPRIGDLVTIRCTGRKGRTRGAPDAVVVEADAVRPLLRGADVKAWRAEPGAHVIWVYDDALRYAPGRRLRAFLAGHADRVRSGGRLQRLGVATLGVKVVWQDIGATLEAAAVPERARAVGGGSAPVIPLNTVYYMPVTAWREALLMTALLNSLPVRVFARTIAERAKDARFRFFAATVAALPAPRDWLHTRCAEGVLAAAGSAHARGFANDTECATIDGAVAAAFGLDAADMHALHEFDAWLSGRPRAAA